MNWFFRIFLLLVAFLVSRLFFSRRLGSSSAKRGRTVRRGSVSGVRSVGSTSIKDPLCGTYVDPALAFPLELQGGGTLLFCSASCRDAYRAKLASASGVSNRA